MQSVRADTGQVAPDSAAAAGTVAAGKDVNDEELAEGSDDASECEEELWPSRTLPEDAQRRCTDVGWLIAFSVIVGFVAYLDVAGVRGADVHRLFHFQNSDGVLCGTGAMSHAPHYYVCIELNADGSVETVGRGICRGACPAGTNSTSDCDFVDSNGTLVRRRVADIPAFSFSGDLYCMPTDDVIWQRVWNDTKLADSEWDDRLLLWMKMVTTAWEPIAVVAAVSVVASYVYLFLVRLAARLLIRTGLFLLTFGPTVFGISALTCAQIQQPLACSVASHVDPDLGETRLRVCGVLVLLVGLRFAVLGYRQGNTVSDAIDCLEWAFELISRSSTLALHPLNMLLIRGAFIMVFFWAILQVCSLFYEDISTRNHDADLISYVFAFAVLFAFYWAMEFCGHLSHFIVVYTTQVWHFREHGAPARSRWPTGLVALWVAVRYHLGTLAKSSLICGLLFPVYPLLGIYTAIARGDANPLARLLGACCRPIEPFVDMAAPYKRDALFEVARSSQPFCEAAAIVEEVTSSEGSASLVMNGATTIFQVAGLGLIGSHAFMLCQMLLAHGIGDNNYRDRGSSEYVFNKVVEAIVAVLVSIVVSFPFLMLFDIVSDTVFFCRAIEGLWQEQDGLGAPEDADKLTWTDSVHSYFTSATGCACTWRPNKAVSSSPSAKEASLLVAEGPARRSKSASSVRTDKGSARGIKSVD